MAIANARSPEGLTVRPRTTPATGVAQTRHKQDAHAPSSQATVAMRPV